MKAIFVSTLLAQALTGALAKKDTGRSLYCNNEGGPLPENTRCQCHPEMHPVTSPTLRHCEEPRLPDSDAPALPITPCLGGLCQSTKPLDLGWLYC
ncbi:hypothetical protein IAQ61_004300, partial [Plenodomus lingam]|uniref:uncharacterized protein n=1 Tax=Leptosphaeria maculans TaxID=5022 RepID=UPI003319B592